MKLHPNHRRIEATDVPSLAEVRALLLETLQLDEHLLPLDPQFRLLDRLPQLDSMALVAVLTALEEHFGITVADDDVSADTFASLGQLTAYVASKRLSKS